MVNTRLVIRSRDYKVHKLLKNLFNSAIMILSGGDQNEKNRN